jgi:uncharacterized protein YxeA
MKKIVFIILLLVFSLVCCSTVKSQESVSQGVDSLIRKDKNSPWLSDEIGEG